MKYATSLLALLLITSALWAQRAQFRGENRDGVYNETGLLKSWPANGPQSILTVTGIGTGYSSAVVAGETIFVTGMKDQKDILSAIGFDGNIKWQVPYGDSWTKSFPDTRVTPTVDGDRIYLLSGTGRLVCFDAASGKELWAAEVDKEYECQWHDWGVAESPLVIDNLVVCTPAGNKTTAVALDKMTGKPVWQTIPVGGQRAYPSPMIYQYNNLRYILVNTTTHIAALVPATGEVAWSYQHWQADRDAMGDGGQIYCNNPVMVGNGIFLTRGYNYPAIMLTMAPDGKSVTEKWINQTLDNHHHGVIATQGFIYGSNWLNNGKGKWVCLDWNSGEVKWEFDWFNKGPIIFADGMLYLMDEKSGNFGLVRPDPAKFDLVSSFKVPKGSGPFWSHPSIYDGKLFIRHGDVLMVYDIKAKT